MCFTTRLPWRANVVDGPSSAEPPLSVLFLANSARSNTSSGCVTGIPAYGYKAGAQEAWRCAHGGRERSRGRDFQAVDTINPFSLILTGSTSTSARLEPFRVSAETPGDTLN